MDLSRIGLSFGHTFSPICDVFKTMSNFSSLQINALDLSDNFFTSEATEEVGKMVEFLRCKGYLERVSLKGLCFQERKDYHRLLVSEVQTLGFFFVCLLK